MGGAALAVLARGLLVRAQRAAWLTIGAGVACWCLGDLYYTLFLEGPGAAGGGGLSPADVLYLSFYPCCYVALVLLLAAHLHETRIAMWLDGLIGGLAAATVGAALVLPPILHSAHGDAASLGVALAYPIGDLLLLAFALGALAMTGWRPGRVWLLIAAALLVTAVADSAYLYLTATDTLPRGQLDAEPVAALRGAAGARRVDPLAAARAAGGWRGGGWCRCPRSRCSPRWGCWSTATSPPSTSRRPPWSWRRRPCSRCACTWRRPCARTSRCSPARGAWR